MLENVQGQMTVFSSHNFFVSVCIYRLSSLSLKHFHLLVEKVHVQIMERCSQNWTLKFPQMCSSY